MIKISVLKFYFEKWTVISSDLLSSSLIFISLFLSNQTFDIKENRTQYKFQLD